MQMIMILNRQVLFAFARQTVNYAENAVAKKQSEKSTDVRDEAVKSTLNYVRFLARTLLPINWVVSQLVISVYLSFTGFVGSASKERPAVFFALAHQTVNYAENAVA